MKFQFVQSETSRNIIMNLIIIPYIQTSYKSECWQDSVKSVHLKYFPKWLPRLGSGPVAVSASDPQNLKVLHQCLYLCINVLIHCFTHQHSGDWQLLTLIIHSDWTQSPPCCRWSASRPGSAADLRAAVRPSGPAACCRSADRRSAPPCRHWARPQGG